MLMVPGHGIGTIRFGLKEADIAAELGPAKRRTAPSTPDTICLHYRNMTVFLSADSVTRISVTELCEDITFAGRPLFLHTVGTLAAALGEVWESDGSAVFIGNPTGLHVEIEARLPGVTWPQRWSECNIISATVVPFMHPRSNWELISGEPNPTSEGIRQPADGSPKPSM